MLHAWYFLHKRNATVVVKRGCSNYLSIIATKRRGIHHFFPPYTAEIGSQLNTTADSSLIAYGTPDPSKRQVEKKNINHESSTIPALPDCVIALLVYGRRRLGSS
jgi:hypothetical protein